MSYIYDVSDAPLQGVLPDGSYAAQIYDVKENRTNGGDLYLNVDFKILDGPFKDYVTTEPYYIESSKSSFKSRERSRFANLCNVCGKPSKGLIEELLGGRCVIQLRIEKGAEDAEGNKRFPDRNRLELVSPITTYKAGQKGVVAKTFAEVAKTAVLKKPIAKAAKREPEPAPAPAPAPEVTVEESYLPTDADLPPYEKDGDSPF